MVSRDGLPSSSSLGQFGWLGTQGLHTESWLGYTASVGSCNSRKIFNVEVSRSSQLAASSLLPRRGPRRRKEARERPRCPIKIKDPRQESGLVMMILQGSASVSPGLGKESS